MSNERDLDDLIAACAVLEDIGRYSETALISSLRRLANIEARRQGFDDYADVARKTKKDK